jgi:hypothetical protein
VPAGGRWSGRLVQSPRTNRATWSGRCWTSGPGLVQKVLDQRTRVVHAGWTGLARRSMRVRAAAEWSTLGTLQPGLLADAQGRPLVRIRVRTCGLSVQSREVLGLNGCAVGQLALAVKGPADYGAFRAPLRCVIDARSCWPCLGLGRHPAGRDALLRIVPAVAEGRYGGAVGATSWSQTRTELSRSSFVEFCGSPASFVGGDTGLAQVWERDGVPVPGTDPTERGRIYSGYQGGVAAQAEQAA